MPRENKTKAVIAILCNGKLRDAIRQVAAEVGDRPDILDVMTDAETGRRLLAWAIKEHLEGRGPWPK